MDNTNYSSIWDTLSKVDVSKHIQKKGGLSYLPWAAAWTTLMEHYPESQFSFGEDRVLQDGSVEVQCTVHIGQSSRHITLPVMDYKNAAICNPDSRQLNDNRMRCLVKCLALFGLGLHLYRGEDVNPDIEKPAPVKITEQQAVQLEAGIEAVGIDMHKFLTAYKVESLRDMSGAQFENAANIIKKRSAEAAKA